MRIVIADPRTREVPVPRRFVCHSVEDKNCQVRFTFTGKIDKLRITLEPPRLTPEDKTLQAAKASAANAHKPRDVQFGSFATGLSQQQVQPCPLCPDSDQIPHRSEMSRCAMSGSRVLSLPIIKFSVAWHPGRGWCASVRQAISWGQFDASICRSAPRYPPFDGSISRMANCARSPSREMPASSRWRGFVSRMQRVPMQQPLLRING